MLHIYIYIYIYIYDISRLRVKADIESVMYAPNGTYLVLWRSNKKSVTPSGWQQLCNPPRDGDQIVRCSRCMPQRAPVSDDVTSKSDLYVFQTLVQITLEQTVDIQKILTFFFFQFLIRYFNPKHYCKIHFNVIHYVSFRWSVTWRFVFFASHLRAIQPVDLVGFLGWHQQTEYY